MRAAPYFDGYDWAEYEAAHDRWEMAMLAEGDMAYDEARLEVMEVEDADE